MSLVFYSTCNVFTEYLIKIRTMCTVLFNIIRSIEFVAENKIMTSGFDLPISTVSGLRQNQSKSLKLVSVLID